MEDLVLLVGARVREVGAKLCTTPAVCVYLPIIVFTDNDITHTVVCVPSVFSHALFTPSLQTVHRNAHLQQTSCLSKHWSKIC